MLLPPPLLSPTDTPFSDTTLFRSSPVAGKRSGNARPGLVQHGRKRLFGRRDVEKGVDLVDQPVLYRHQLTIIIVVDAPILIFEMPHHLDHHAIRLGSRLNSSH